MEFHPALHPIKLAIQRKVPEFNYQSHVYDFFHHVLNRALQVLDLSNGLFHRTHFTREQIIHANNLLRQDAYTDLPIPELIRRIDNIGEQLYGSEKIHPIPIAFIQAIVEATNDFHAKDRLLLELPLVDENYTAKLNYNVPSDIVYYTQTKEPNIEPATNPPTIIHINCSALEIHYLSITVNHIATALSLLPRFNPWMEINDLIFACQFISTTLHASTSRYTVNHDLTIQFEIPKNYVLANISPLRNKLQHEIIIPVHKHIKDILIPKPIRFRPPLIHLPHLPKSAQNVARLTTLKVKEKNQPKLYHEDDYHA